MNTFPCLCFCCCVDRTTHDPFPARTLEARQECTCQRRATDLGVIEDLGQSVLDECVAALFDLGGQNRELGELLLQLWKKVQTRVYESYAIDSGQAALKVIQENRK